MSELLRKLCLSLILFVVASCGGSKQGGSDETPEERSMRARNAAIAASLGPEAGLPYGVSGALASATYGQPASQERIDAAAKQLSGYFGKTLSLQNAAEIQPKTLSDTPASVYRFYNSRTGVHFYTISEAEKNHVQENLPVFAYEGQAFAALKTTSMSLSSVYRFYNVVTGTHFYTISESEKETVSSTLSNIFQYEGVAWQGSTSAGSGWIPIFRFFNRLTGAHFYTASAAERDSVKASLPQMAYEGIAYYVRQGTTFTGQFVDAPVAGLKYKTAAREGITDALGGFVYDIPNESIEFSVGAQSLGIAKANSVVDVFALKGSTQDQYVDRGSRVAQFLQTIGENIGSTNTLSIDIATSSSGIFSSNVLDFNAPVVTFGAQLASVATSLGNTVVSESVARVNAASYLSSLSAECPLQQPPRPYGVGGNSYITCLDRARINYFDKVIRPGLNNTRDEATAQLALVQDTFSEEAMQAVIDANPVISALNLFDTVVDWQGAVETGSIAQKAGVATKAVMLAVKSIVDTYVLVAQSQDAADAAIKVGKQVELSNHVLDTIMNSSDCYDYFAIGPRKESAIATCSRGIKAALELAQQSLDPNRSVFSVASDYSGVDAILRVLAVSLDAADQVYKLQPKSTTPEALRRNSFILAKAGFQVAKEQVQVAYAAGLTSHAQWKEMLGGAVGAMGDIGLEFANKCFASASPDRAARAQCYTEVARQGIAQSVRLIGAGFGTGFAFKNASTQNEAIVATSVLEELLWVGTDGERSIYSRYGVSFSDATPYAMRESFLNLIRAVASQRYGINAYTSMSERFSSMGGALIAGQQRIDAESVHDLTLFYLQVINQNVALDVALPSIQLSATDLGSGRVNVSATVNPAASGFVNGTLVCHATSSTTHSISAPWKVAVQGSTSSQVTMSFPAGGTKPITCALYSASGLYAGSNSIRANVNWAPRFTSMNPRTAVLDYPTTFTVTGTGLPLTAQLVLGSFAECQEPTNRTNNGFVQVCTPRGTTGSKIFTLMTDSVANGGKVIVMSGPLVIIDRYSLVGNYAREECVKDNATGLIWEGKTAGGVRAGANMYTNFDDPTQPQFWNGIDFVNPSQTQIDNASNSQGYTSYVNSTRLCGFTNWRLPTRDELVSLWHPTDANLVIDHFWFPNTQSWWYWTSSPYTTSSQYGDDAAYARIVYFGFRLEGYDHRLDLSSMVRLVRATQ